METCPNIMLKRFEAQAIFHAKTEEKHKILNLHNCWWVTQWPIFIACKIGHYFTFMYLNRSQVHFTNTLKNELTAFLKVKSLKRMPLFLFAVNTYKM